MSQFDFGTIVPADTDGIELAEYLNDWRDALHSNHAGSSRPSYVVEGMLWIDSSVSPPVLNYYDGANDIALFQLAAGAVGELPGTLKLYAGVALPDGYLWADGSAVSRSTYDDLLSAMTVSVTADSSDGSTTLSNVAEDLRNLGLVGAKIEGTGIPSGATIASVTATTLTLSAAATADGTAIALRIFPWGNGNGSTTFTLPDYKDRGFAGRGDMGGTAASRLTAAGGGLDGTLLGRAGGAETHTLTTAQIPAHSHTASASGTASNAGGHSHTYSGSSTTAAQTTVHTHQYSTPVLAGPYTVSFNGSLSYYVATGLTTGVSSGQSGDHHHSYSWSGTTSTQTDHTHTLSLSVTVNNAGGGGAHPNVQPTGICNVIIKT